MLYSRQRTRLLIGLFVSLFLIVIPNTVIAGDNNIFWNELGHNSRDALYRYPQGAVSAGTPVTLRIRAADGDLTGASVRFWNDRDNFEMLVPMTLAASGVEFQGDPTVYEFWEATLPVSALPTVYWYRFILNDGTATAYYEDDAARLGGWGQTFGSSPDNSWQLTMYDPAFQTPDWIQNGVVYQIFTDRFRDGVAGNQTPAGSFFYGNFDTVYRSNDVSGEWNTEICDPRNVLGTNVCNDIYSQNFYGGDLPGITEKLDYLQSLGVTVLYLNPIFESPSNHKYDTTDFLQIDDNFGTLADFEALTTAAHARGMRVVLDGVFNHSSSDSIYFDRYSRWDINGNPTTIGANDESGACESLNSPYVGWYTFFPYAGVGASPCSDGRDYPKWFGIFDSLPVYNHDNPEVRDLFINNGTNSVGPYWMQWADGWRLDVAPEVDHGTINDPGDNYWENFRTAVHAVRPDAYIVGEEWGNATSWTIGGEWDATMNYQFSAATLSFMRDSAFTDNDFNGGSSAGPLNPNGPGAFNERLLYLQERSAPEAWYAMMNLFGSHDTNRVLFLLDDNAGSSSNTALFTDPNYDWSPAISRLRGAALIQMTMPGAPTIYYGDEVGTVNPPSWDGSQWQDDPYNRVPYPWLDESGTPFYAHMQSAVSQQALFDYYAQLTSIRNSNPALRTGSFDPLLTDDANGVYAYGRQMADMSNTAVVVVNNSSVAKSATVSVLDYVPVNTLLIDALTGVSYPVSNNGDVTVNVPSNGGVILTYAALSRPGTVFDLAATSQSAQVDLTWSAIAGATSYDVYRSRLTHGGFELIGNTASNNYSDTSVANSVPYVYRIEAKIDATQLTGDASNEVSATPALSIGWANLQWPPSLTESVSATNLSGDVYGQIWIDGATSQPGATPGLWAQVGYGDSNNVNDGSWLWFDMLFNSDAGNNDEFKGNLPRTDVGTFCYTTRYSTDSGASWFYAVNGPDEGNTTCPGPFGVLTIIPAGDIIAPAAPINLAVAGTTDSSVALAWDAHLNTDGDLYGFRVYREDTSAPGFSQVKEVVGAGTTGTSDDTAVNGSNYNYYIIAIDANLNESGTSNTVNADAILQIVQVTFRVTVPDFTPGVFPVHIVGPFNGWNPGDPAHALTEVSPDVWEIMLDVIDGTSFEHKYARSSWDRVEKADNGYDEVSNRFVSIDYGTNGTQIIEETIVNWRDPIVTGFTPVDDSVDVDSASTISVSWNKWMPTPPGGFLLTGASGAVAGSFTFDEPSLSHTFTPSAAFEPGLHTVAIAGAANGSDVQQVPAEWDFAVIEPFAVTGISLINADTNLPVAAYDPIPDGGNRVLIDLATLGTGRLNLRANVSEAARSVIFDVNSILANRIENGAPYAFAGDNNGDYNAWTFNINTDYLVRATPYIATNGQGDAGNAASVLIRFVNSVLISPTINLVPDQVNNNGDTIIQLQIVASDDGADLAYVDLDTLPPGLSINYDTGSISGVIDVAISENTIYPVTISVRDEDGNISTVNFNWTVNYVEIPPLAAVSLTLIDADSDLPIATYIDGEIIEVDTGVYGTAFNIRADVQGNAGSVTFDVNDVLNIRTENGAPFALAGDNNGDYASWLIELNTAYSVVATPFAEAYGNGDAGGSINVTFIFVDASASVSEAVIEPEVTPEAEVTEVP